MGLVVIVSALSAGLDDAQEQALAPLTGVGTDMRVSRPLTLPGRGEPGGPGAASLSDDEQRRLEKENPEGLFHFEPGELGEPGQPFITHDQWVAERADRVLRLADGRLVDDMDRAGSR